MSTQPNNPPGQPGPDPNRQKMLAVLVPAAGVALVVVLVAILASSGTSEPSGKDKGGRGSGSGGANVSEGPGQAMSDGSNGGTDDPDLKDIGQGLKIRDLKVGDGPAVQPGARVKVHYTGWTVDGKVFDSSKRRGEPIEFSLNQVVKGWGQGIPGMKPGGIRKLVIPAALGYGAQGSGAIPPDATLIFEVELIASK